VRGSLRDHEVVGKKSDVKRRIVDREAGCAEESPEPDVPAFIPSRGLSKLESLSLARGDGGEECDRNKHDAPTLHLMSLHLWGRADISRKEARDVKSSSAGEEPTNLERQEG
jgi:hypothetical protein